MGMRPQDSTALMYSFRISLFTCSSLPRTSSVPMWIMGIFSLGTREHNSLIRATRALVAFSSLIFTLSALRNIWLCPGISISGISRMLRRRQYSTSCLNSF